MFHQGLSVGRRRISRLMKEAGLACKTRRRFKEALIKSFISVLA
ncbi:MAG: transposase [Nitrosomonas sp.]|nr:transposase [Nitrosomonas sp.]